ncbi:MAG: YaaA family protein [Epsilonproteobacteria bacterium]|nr:YaaA family protein [Campylobacterota bacterium]
MIILFAPSEAKRDGGDHKNMRFCVDIDRKEILQEYDRLVKDPQTALKLFGTKEMLQVDIFASPTLKAVRRYTGVAYKYLDYDSLPSDAQSYIDDRLIIFSNLFGVLCAKDLIPFYKLKQGSAVGDIKPEKYYKERLKTIDLGDEVLDLRAGYYEKFYKPKYCVKMKFLKNDKVVSHWAKAYRGKIAREIALHHIDSFEALRSHTFEGLQLIEIQQKRDHELWVFEVSS